MMVGIVCDNCEKVLSDEDCGGICPCGQIYNDFALKVALCHHEAKLDILARARMRRDGIAIAAGKDTESLILELANVTTRLAATYEREGWVPEEIIEREFDSIFETR